MKTVLLFLLLFLSFLSYGKSTQSLTLKNESVGQMTAEKENENKEKEKKAKPKKKEDEPEYDPTLPRHLQQRPMLVKGKINDTTATNAQLQLALDSLKSVQGNRQEQPKNPFQKTYSVSGPGFASNEGALTKSRPAEASKSSKIIGAEK